MSAFAAAANVLFNDPNIARAATYHVGESSEGTPIRIIRSQPDQVSDFNGGRFVSDSSFIDVRVSEVPLPSKHDRFVVDEQTLIVVSDPVRDSERLIWKVECRAL